MFYEGNKILTMLERKQIPLGIQCLTGNTALIEIIGATGLQWPESSHTGPHPPKPLV
jgi:hypothetical protein